MLLEIFSWWSSCHLIAFLWTEYHLILVCSLGFHFGTSFDLHYWLFINNIGAYHLTRHEILSNFALLNFPFRSIFHFSRNRPPPVVVRLSSQATTHPSLQKFKLEKWECDFGPSKYLNMLVFLCIKKHTLWCVSVGSGGLHCATSLIRGMDWSACCPTMDLVPLISTGSHFYYFYYLSYLFWLFNFSLTLWNLEKCPTWKLLGIIFFSIILFILFIYLNHSKLLLHDKNPKKFVNYPYAIGETFDSLSFLFWIIFHLV